MLRVSLVLLISVEAMGFAYATESALSDPAQITPPELLELTAAQRASISNCYAFSARRHGYAGRVMVKATIGTDGRVIGHELKQGVEPWQAKSAECVLGVLRFKPATRNGVPVEAEAKVPVAFNLEGSAPAALPQVVTPPTEFEGIIRRCYPPDEAAIQEISYRVTIAASGKARKIELVESSGVASLDQAGRCILESLTYEPARRGKTAIESTAVMPVQLRPPK
jgi:outer membrane biosynthesis protein TonB